MSSIRPPLSKRRTVAIISHPDAGKTTLTEKFLLYGGVIEQAGSVTARRRQRATASDWMAMEQQRGISISSTVLQFDYDGYRVNLLDTPGHQDFSEDTYRVLTAVDAAIMIIDAGKGVEARTRKLFEICRMRGIPIFTFINKLDRPARPPIGLLDEVEEVLGIASYPMNWPLGDGPRFGGVIDRQGGALHLFERTPHGAYRAPEEVVVLADLAERRDLDPELARRAIEELELLEAAGADFDPGQVASGKLTPVFFGSAANNFGIELLLNGFLKWAPGPTGRRSGSDWISPGDERFSAFVFKIQANMNPKHRDRMAFIRIVSGKFERDMAVWHAASGRTLRLSNPQRLFAQERETVEEAWAGDVVGLVGNQPFGIGDTLSTCQKVAFDEIPAFTPECFAAVRSGSAAKAKRFRAGLTQMVSEGVVQMYGLAYGPATVPLLAAVGPLQFEVFKERIESEYGAEVIIEGRRWKLVRWLAIDGRPPEDGEIAALRPPGGCAFARDPVGNWTLLAEGEWAYQIAARYQRDWTLNESPPASEQIPS